MPAKTKKLTFRDAAKYLIFATNVIAIILLCSAWLAWKVSPLKTNFFSYVGLFFGLILFVNIFYLIFWLFFSKWKLAFISFIALLVSIKPITTFFPLHLQSGKKPEKTIKILTYNVESFQNEYRKSATEHPILDYIAKTDADIVCLQEYMISKTGNSMITQRDVNRILNQYPYRSITGLESSGRYHILGLACFSKYPIKNTHEIIFDASYNGAAVYTIEINDSLYTVANVHLESNQITAEDKKLYSDFLQNKDSVNLDEITSNIRKRMGKAYRKRVEQVKKITTHIDKQKTAATIICGDMNDTPISYAYKHLKRDLADSYASTGFGSGITYHQDFFLFRIDYIFHSKHLKAYKTKVDKIKYSDHYPLHTYLERKD